MFFFIQTALCSSLGKLQPENSGKAGKGPWVFFIKLLDISTAACHSKNAFVFSSGLAVAAEGKAGKGSFVVLVTCKSDFLLVNKQLF